MLCLQPGSRSLLTDTDLISASGSEALGQRGLSVSVLELDSRLTTKQPTTPPSSFPDPASKTLDLELGEN